MKNVTLNNGIEMPIIGFGVYQIDMTQCESCVLDAIAAGYRLIDTAQAYGNEEAVGKAVERSGVFRNELFVTSKIWIKNAGYEKAKASIEASLDKLRTDYIDLMLIHQPFNDYYGTYRAMTEAYEAGKIRAIGVSNFYPDRLIDLCQFSRITPAVNQVETHPFNQQKKARKIMEKYGVQIMSWGPFAEGRDNMFDNEVIKSIAQKYNKTSAQVILRFLIQQDIVVIPKTVHHDRMLENIDIFDFELAKDDMDKLSALDKGESAFFSHYDPDTVEYLTNLGK